MVEAIQRLGYRYEFCGILSTVSECGTQLQTTVPDGVSPPSIASFTGKPKSWLLNYTVLSFLMNGQLFAEYNRISNMLGLPSCSDKQWHRIAEWLGDHVTALAEWTCEEVRRQVVERGDQRAWVVSFDGYYQTHGHYSNNSSATLHDHETSRIAWFKHRTKRGPGHNWEGTSNGAEGDMFNEILGEVRDAGFNVTELITDKDASTNAIYCRHFPEGTVTFCSNHTAKTLHKDLQKIKQEKSQVSYHLCVQHYITLPCSAGLWVFLAANV